MSEDAAMWKDFKAFAFKGNVIDLAVAVVIGAAFSKIVTVLVETVIMPLVGKLLPSGSYTGWSPAGIHVGVLIGAVIDFVIVAFVLFLVVSAIKRATTRRELAPAPAAPAEPPAEVKLLAEIRDLLRAK